MSVFSAVAEIMLGMSSLLGDMGDYDDYSSLIEPFEGEGSYRDAHLYISIHI